MLRTGVIHSTNYKRLYRLQPGCNGVFSCLVLNSNPNPSNPTIAPLEATYERGAHTSDPFKEKARGHTRGPCVGIPCLGDDLVQEVGPGPCDRKFCCICRVPIASVDGLYIYTHCIRIELSMYTVYILHTCIYIYIARTLPIHSPRSFPQTSPCPKGLTEQRF